jgi:hypothetical protein
LLPLHPCSPGRELATGSWDPWGLLFGICAWTETAISHSLYPGTTPKPVANQTVYGVSLGDCGFPRGCS